MHFPEGPWKESGTFLLLSFPLAAGVQERSLELQLPPGAVGSPQTRSWSMTIVRPPCQPQGAHANRLERKLNNFII